MFVSSGYCPWFFSEVNAKEQSIPKGVAFAKCCLYPLLELFGQKIYGVKVEFLLYLKSQKEWIFSGIGVFFIAGVVTLIKRHFSKDMTSPSIANSQNVVVNMAPPMVGITNMPDAGNSNRLQIMSGSRILFIDDETDFPVIKVIRQAGWKNVAIKKDIVSFNTAEIVAVDIFFVDIRGVGKAMQFTDEGLGLAKALKIHFGNKKKVVIYSAEPRGETFHDAWSLVDGRLRKDAQPYEYLQLLDNLSGIKNG